MGTDEWGVLSGGRRTGKLACVMASGRPTVTPIWFVDDDDGPIRLETGGEFGEAKALAAEPGASMVVDLEAPPFASSGLPPRRNSSMNRMSSIASPSRPGAYMGADRAEESGKRNSGTGQVVIELHPTKVTAKADLAD